MTIDEYLNQDKIWSSANKELRIEDMDEVYRRRACDWLLRNTTSLHQMWLMEWYMDHDQEPSLDAKLRKIDERPYSWIKRTPLFRALSAGIPDELLRRTPRN